MSYLKGFSSKHYKETKTFILDAIMPHWLTYVYLNNIIIGYTGMNGFVCDRPSSWKATL